MPHRYRLRKDLPGIKAGTEIKPLSALAYGYISDGLVHLEWANEYIYQHPDYFQLIKEEPAKEAFQWDETKVEELLTYMDTHCLGIESYLGNKKSVIENFKQSLNPSLHERIEYSKDDVVGLLRDAVSETWGNPSIDETQTLFDQFLHKRKLAPPSKSYLNKFVSNKFNEILLDKKYTQFEMDKAIEDAFNAAREKYAIDPSFQNEGWKSKDKYRTFNDYLTHLKSLKVK